MYIIYIYIYIHTHTHVLCCSGSLSTIHSTVTQEFLYRERRQRHRGHCGQRQQFRVWGPCPSSLRACHLAGWGQGGWLKSPRNRRISCFTMRTMFHSLTKCLMWSCEVSDGKWLLNYWFRVFFPCWLVGLIDSTFSIEDNMILVPGSLLFSILGCHARV